MKRGIVETMGLRWPLVLVVLMAGTLAWFVWPEKAVKPVTSAAPAEPADVAPVVPKLPDLPPGPQEDAQSVAENSDSSAYSRLRREKEAVPVPAFEELVKRLDSGDMGDYSTLARTVTGKIQSGEPLSAAFDRAGLDYPTTLLILDTFKGVFDFRRIHPGDRWLMRFDEQGRLQEFGMQTARLEAIYAVRDGERLAAFKLTGEVVTRVVGIAGTINMSLSVALWRLGETDALTQQIADILAWDIDFYSDIQRGDTFRVRVEKRFHNGRFMGYGKVLSAVFDGAFMGHRSAYYFESDDGRRMEYFDKDGNSLQKSFLRAPLNTTRVTSSFGFRMHPTQHKYKKHNGVDYGAPSGTPIWAIASGVVQKAGRMGACGIGATIKHANNYTSVYCHMSSIYVKNGQRVAQKKMIGRVGSTGRSTGPHLHFGMMKNGSYINPQKLKYEPGKPIDPQYKEIFLAQMQTEQAALLALELPVFYGPDIPEGMTVTEAGLEGEYVDPNVNSLHGDGEDLLDVDATN